MSYHIDISPHALKALSDLKRGQPAFALRISNAIDELKDNPFSGKKLMGPLSDFRSLRVGQYRVIYSVIEKRLLIEIVKIAHRKDVYR